MKKTSLFVVLFLAAFGGFIGFDQNSTTGNLAASAPIVFPEMPRPVSLGPLTLRVDLETGQLDVDNARNRDVNVEVNHKTTVVETPPKYITKLKFEKVYVQDIVKTNKLLDRICPLGNPAPLQIPIN